MFIPIHAKADIVGEKKGKITPAQASQLNAWCLASKTGILDIYNNTTKEYERCEATATSYSINNNVATIVFNKGYIVICGRLVEVEKNTRIDIDTSANPSGKIILSFNLSSSGKEEFKVEVVNRNLRQYDLNENPISGVYEFELYSYSTTGSTLTLTRSNKDYIPDIGGKLNQFITVLTGTGVVGSGNPPLQAYNKSKGTIEERFTSLDSRLNRLGFKSGVINFLGDNYGSENYINTTQNGIYRVGNFVICKVNTIQSNKGSYLKDNATIFTLPTNFRPKDTITINLIGMYNDSPTVAIYMRVNIDKNGNGIVKSFAYGKSATSTNNQYTYNLNFGFEASPIN